MATGTRRTDEEQVDEIKQQMAKLRAKLSRKEAQVREKQRKAKERHLKQLGGLFEQAGLGECSTLQLVGLLDWAREQLETDADLLPEWERRSARVLTGAQSEMTSSGSGLPTPEKAAVTTQIPL